MNESIPSNAPPADVGPHALLWKAALRQLSLEGLKRTPPMWRESRAWFELGRFLMHPISRGVGLPRGEGRPVFFIPGYLAGDASLTWMASSLRAAGFAPEMAGLRMNVACSTTMMASLETRLEAHVKASGQKAVVIGQSRGGALGRWLAVRRPDLVARLVTLGTPLTDPLAIHVLVLMNLGMVGSLGRLTAGRMLSTDCLRLDGCCASAWREGLAPLPAGVPFASIYSRTDGIVDWRACLDPAARHIEVDSSHCGMAFSVDVMQALAHELRP